MRSFDFLTTALASFWHQNHKKLFFVDQVAMDGGDYWTSYTHPWSMTSKVQNMTDSSNCGLNGRWVYRVDQTSVQFPNQRMFTCHSEDLTLFISGFRVLIRLKPPVSTL
jgi:hypothetical protein